MHIAPKYGEKNNNLILYTLLNVVDKKNLLKEI